MKIRIEDFWYSRLEEIEKELKQQYCKGKGRNKSRIAQLFKEKKELNSRLAGIQKEVF